jgi:hypothetical protein
MSQWKLKEMDEKIFERNWLDWFKNTIAKQRFKDFKTKIYD